MHSSTRPGSPTNCFRHGSIAIGLLLNLTTAAMAIPGCPSVTKDDVTLLKSNYKVIAVMIATPEVSVPEKMEGKWVNGSFSGAYVTTYWARNPVLLLGHLKEKGEFRFLGKVVYGDDGERQTDSNPSTLGRALIAIRPNFGTGEIKYEIWGNKLCQ